MYMADSVLDAFYVSAPWRKCRQAFIVSKGGLCEECLKAGQISPGIEVHHVIKLTPANVNDPAVALNWDNLRLLCEEHHHAVHSKRQPRRWKVDEYGRVQNADGSGLG